MNYQKVYDSLVYKRQHIDIIPKKQKYIGERHHIVPKSWGGSDDASNIVKLTHREHFVAHLLLVKIAENRFGINSSEANYMKYAAWQMSNEHPKKYKTISCKKSSRTYASLREQFCKLVGESAKKRFLGTHLSEARKEQNRIDSSNRVWVHIPSTKECHFVKKENVEKYIANGYVMGRAPHKKPRPYKINMTPERKKHYHEIRTGKNNPMYGKNVQDYMTADEIARWKKNISAGHQRRNALKKAKREARPIA